MIERYQHREMFQENRSPPYMEWIEDFIFNPLVLIGKRRENLERFVVEVNWIRVPGAKDWDALEKPFVLKRVKKWE